jgi:hypothetical protein
MARAVMRPLTSADRMQPRWENGETTSAIASAFIKPNDRLSSFERLEIYNRQYWFRLLDCLHDDFPGLRALLGDSRFLRLITAYLQKHPSTSATLRDLGRHLVDFLRNEPAWTAPHEAVCLDMARLEWAQIVAFDGPSRPRASLRSLSSLPPESIFLRLQPHITLLDLAYPVDEAAIRILRQDDNLRSETSNAMEPPDRPRRRAIASRIQPQRTHLLVHRQDNAVFFKRLIAPEHHLIRELDTGTSLASACESLAQYNSVTPDNIRTWFQTWATLGFFTLRSAK